MQRIINLSDFYPIKQITIQGFSGSWMELKVHVKSC